jgi:hypothetical protein
MSLPTTVDDLLGLVRKSGLVGEQRLQDFVNKMTQGDGLPSEPRELADRMIKDGLITNFRPSNIFLANGAASPSANTNCSNELASAAWVRCSFANTCS